MNRALFLAALLALTGCGKQLDRLLTGEDHDRNNGQPPHQQVYTFTQLVHTVEQYTEPGTGLIKFTDPNHYSAAIYTLPDTTPVDFVRVVTQDVLGNQQRFNMSSVADGSGPSGYLRSGHNVVEFFNIQRDYPLAVSIEVAWEAQ